MRKLPLLLLCFMPALTILNAQEPVSFDCTGILRDQITRQPLANVRIFHRDTLPEALSDAHGAFRIRLRAGNRLQFRKRGYGWHTICIAREEKLDISLSPSKPELVRSDPAKVYIPEYPPSSPTC
jgi:hypothetical protein